ncbi:hypothetical protein FIBSPDRAFT_863488 [Athelia psychrophila]|uniref:Secreted protein n=1 Tax=Athelia psychrophila TaxID=1759441 RepID=A0A166HC78_9AGAM|nr:hypothetical protein FIBSPDRAFT_863488 [Fibularhizoctonia sp. CBS 109695]
MGDLLVTVSIAMCAMRVGGLATGSSEDYLAHLLTCSRSDAFWNATPSCQGLARTCRRITEGKVHSFLACREHVKFSKGPRAFERSNGVIASTSLSGPGFGSFECCVAGVRDDVALQGGS